MSEEKKITARVIVADRPYVLSIVPSQEQAIREAAKRLNAQFYGFKEQGIGQDEFGALIIAALQIIIPLIDAELKDDSGRLMAGLQKINKKVEEYISIAQQ